MDHLSSKRFQSFDFWPVPPAEATDSGEQNVGGDLYIFVFIMCHALADLRVAVICASSGSFDSQMPFSCFLVVLRTGETVLELDVGTQVEFLHYRLEIGLDFGTGSVERGPVELGTCVNHMNYFTQW